jgi:hypothetical protein
MPCCGRGTSGRQCMTRHGRRVSLQEPLFLICDYPNLLSVHGGSGWKVDKSGPCGKFDLRFFRSLSQYRPGSQAFTASSANCRRDMRARINLAENFRGVTFVRAKICVKGTPPDCADPYTLSLKLKSSEPLPANAALAKCPAGHDCLPFYFSSDRHSCDCCRTAISAGNQGWRCFECNHDVCHLCCRVEFDDADPTSIISNQCADDVCSDKWATIVLHASAPLIHSPQLRALNESAKHTLFSHFSISGRDAEGWAGHYGAAFACPSVSYLGQVEDFNVKHFFLVDAPVFDSFEVRLLITCCRNAVVYCPTSSREKLKFRSSAIFAQVPRLCLCFDVRVFDQHHHEIANS